MSDTTAHEADRQLLTAFENCTLPKAQWTHQAHVRVAFLYIRDHGLTRAIDHMRAGLQALSAARGVPDSAGRGYHETITLAFLHLIAAAHQTAPCTTSEQFCHRFPDLLKKSILQNYYSQEKITSPQAKTNFLEPDLAPLTGS